MISIYEPWIARNQKKYVNECIDKNELTFHGKFIRMFEDDIWEAECHNGQTAVAVSNGSVSLYTILKNIPPRLSGRKYVVTSSFTYAATVSQIILAGYTPLLVDSNEQLQIDEDELERAIRVGWYDIAAVMIPELYADAPNLLKIRRLCDEFCLFMIEDAAESFGCHQDLYRCGEYGHVSSFSFFANKVITCGEGGAICTSDPGLAEKYRLFINQGNIGGYKHNGPASNFRMTNLQAAIGVAQMEEIDTIVDNKQAIAKYYRDNLTCKAIVPSAFYSSEWMPVFKLPPNKKYVDLLKFANEAGFDTRPVFYPLHLLDGFKKYVKLFSPSPMLCETFPDSHFILPCFPAIKNADLKYIVEKTNEFLRIR